MTVPLTRTPRPAARWSNWAGPSGPSGLCARSSLLLLLLRCAAAAGCGLRSGPDDFVLDSEDAVRDGAVLLASAQVLSADTCQRLCCEHARCNLALLEPRAPAAAARNHTCVLFNCVHRNRFVCRFVSQDGYRSFIRRSVFVKHLQGPEGDGEQAPPIAIAGRDVVVQAGAVVTLNGVESLPLGGARITDYRWTVQSGDGGVSLQSTELPDQVRVSALQPGSYIFQLTVTDSNHQSDAANVSVLVLSPEQSSLFCQAPVKVGPCRAAFPRWRYNASTGDCQGFTFGGCKGNNNNFLSKEECLSACKGVTVTSERSVSLPTARVCGSSCSPSQLTCDSGCCLHKSLECDGIEHCSDGADENHCTQLNRTLSRLLDVHLNQNEARCSEPPRTGPCRASLPRWYYNPMHRKCARFTYGGCDPGANNFEKEEVCEDTCRGVTDKSVYFRGMFERFEKEEESGSGTTALAVLLAVAVLAVLAVVAYCFIKMRRKRSRRPVTTGPAHVALSEQDTLVYNSTTKPM